MAPVWTMAFKARWQVFYLLARAVAIAVIGGGGGGVYSYIRVKAGFHSENNPRIGPDRNKI